MTRPALLLALLAAPAFADERAVEPLTQALSTSNEGLQNYAARALAKLGAVEALEPLTELATNGRLAYTPRVGATFAIGRLGSSWRGYVSYLRSIRCETFA